MQKRLLKQQKVFKIRSDWVWSNANDFLSYLNDDC